jgi:pimeloyl-ACP methyl ester carboxylesterase
MWPFRHKSNPVHKTINVQQGKAHYIEAGGGSDKPTLIIVASQMILARSYLWTIHQLYEHFRVISVEVPGCGFSARVSKPWSRFEYAKWIVSFMDELGIDKATLVGHSDSGAPVLRAGVDFPNRVDAIVLVDSIGANVATYPDSLIRLYIARVRDAFMEIRFSIPGFFHIMFNFIVHTINFANQVRVAAVMDLKEDAKQVKVPTLLAWGRHDRTVPLPAAARFFELIPHASVYVSERGCHNWLIQLPKEFCKVVTDFVAHKEPRVVNGLSIGLVDGYLVDGYFEKKVKSLI